MMCFPLIAAKPGQVTLVIQVYEALVILVSLARLAGDTQLQGFRNPVEASMSRLEFLTRQDIHLPLKLTEGYEVLWVMQMGEAGMGDTHPVTQLF